jgi:hypothetical protein
MRVAIGSMTGPRRLAGGLLAAASVVLWLTSVYRAATYPFVHDESLTFTIFTSDPVRAATANHHFLNTWLMWASSVLFGNAPFALRAPNVLAHALYLACVLVLLRRVRSIAVVVAGFALLNLNLFALDFFALARGYGLGLGGTALSLVLLVRAWEDKQRGLSPVRPLCGALGAGALAVLANYVLLNLYAPLLIAGLWMLLTDASGRRVSRVHALPAAAIVVANEAFLAAVIFRLLHLERDGQLYFGGAAGFVQDTVLSLVRSSFYRDAAPEAALLVAAHVVAWSLPAVVVIALLLLWRQREPSLLAALTASLLLAVAAPIVLHAATGALFPIDRAAVGYLPLYGLVVILALDALPNAIGRPWIRGALAVPAAGLAVGLAWVWWTGFNPRTCRTWPSDAHNTSVLDLIDADRRRGGVQPVQLGVSWVLEPSLNFYRTTRGYAWLAPIQREGLTDAGNRYLYFFASEAEKIPAGPHTTLASFSDTGTVLWRMDAR